MTVFAYERQTVPRPCRGWADRVRTRGPHDVTKTLSVFLRSDCSPKGVVVGLADANVPRIASNRDAAPSDFGRLLRSYRQRAGLTQEQLALAVFGNRRKATIGELEKDPHRVPYPHTLKRLGEALGLTAEERTLLATACGSRRPVIPQQPVPERAESSPAHSGGHSADRAGLPRFPTKFFGRDQESQDCAALLRQADAPRLLTVVGPGGTGKTRFCVELARKLSSDLVGDILYVALDPVEDHREVAPEILRALGLHEDPAVTPVDNIVRALLPRRVLVILDNFEQVRDAAQDVAHILERTSRVTVLVTSRVPLNVRGEHVFRLGPLPTPEPVEHGDFEAVRRSEAVRLFIDRAQANSGLQLDENNFAAVAALCRHLDGVPLAVELAAGRTSLFSPEAMVSRLNDSLKLLSRGQRDAPSRHRSLRATLDWSFRLLGQDQVETLEELSVVADSWSVETAEAICTAVDVVELLADLLDSNMLVRAPGNRLRLLRTVREYALEGLKARGAEAGARVRYIDWCITEIEKVAEHQRAVGPAENPATETLEMMRSLHTHIMAALHYAESDGEHERLAALTGAVTDYWVIGGRHRQIKRWVTSALQGEVSVHHRAYLNRAWVAVCLYADGDPSSAVIHAREAERAFRELGLQREAIGMRYTAGNALRWLGRLDEALRDVRDSIEQSESVPEWPASRWHDSNLTLALILDDMGEVGSAETLMKTFLDYARAADLPVSRADGLAAFAVLNAGSQRLAEATALADESLQFIEMSNHDLQEIRVDVLVAVGLCRLRSDRPADAKSLLQEAYTLIGEMGYRLVQPDVLSHLGACAIAMEDSYRAARLFAAGEWLRQRKKMKIVGRLARSVQAEAVQQTRYRLPEGDFDLIASGTVVVDELDELALGW